MALKSKVKTIFDEKDNKIAVLLRIKDFERLMTELEDLKDLCVAYEVKSKNYKTIPYEQVRKELFGDKTKSFSKRNPTTS